VGWVFVLHPVARKERDLAALDGPHGHRSRGFPVGGVDLDLADVVEKRVEPGSPEDADPDGLVAVPSQADFSFVLELDPSEVAVFSVFSVFPDLSDFSDFFALGPALSEEEDSVLSVPLLEDAPVFDLESVE
jgi:hypothetical protein